MTAKELIRGAYDLHVHSAPDVLPRKMDDTEMAGRIRACGMAGYAMKSHFFCTSERAEILNTVYPDVEFIGGVTLNSAVGGINPSVVEMAARSGAKIVWFPTCDDEAERAHVFSGGPDKKLPFWARIILEMKASGIEAPTVALLDGNGELKPEVHSVLDIIAKYDLILATGHISHEETYKLVPAAAAHGVKNIVVTHVDFPSTFYSIEDQKKFVAMGAVMEHCFTTWQTGKCPWETTLGQILAIGADHILLSTDLGQKTNVYPDEGMLEWAEKLQAEGFTDEEIRTMMVTIPKKLLGKE